MQETLKNVRERLKNLSNGGKLKNIIIIAGIAGIALIFISSLSDLGLFSSASADDSFSVEAYAAETQSSLESVISQIEGVGEAKVMLTMENSVEYVYLDNGTAKTKEIEPVIRGVLVVCEGGGNPVTVERITSAVCRALDISSAKVCIEKLSE